MNRYYLNALKWNENYEKGQKLIDFALTIKGEDKALILSKQALLLECLGKYNKALKSIKTAKRHTYNLEEIKKRVKSKMPKKKKEEKFNKSKKKKNAK